MVSDILTSDLDSIIRRVDRTRLEGLGVVVTGGAGFLGSWLCDVLTLAGSEVTCIDNFSTGLTRNIHHLLDKKNFHLIRENIQHVVPERYAMKPRLILHLASRASPEEYQQHPIETMETNSAGTKSMLELARVSDAPLLYASTSEVYGDVALIPTPETYWGNVNPIGARSCYHESKRFGEALCMAYLREYGVDVRIVRIFNTYGPRLRGDGAYGRALSRFVSQALQNKDLTVYGDGLQTRSFCYVADTVAGMLRSALDDRAKGEVINIGNPHETRILELARNVLATTKSKSRIIFKPLPEDDPRRRCPDITKARRLLDWSPEVELQKGLEKTIRWFQEYGLPKL